MATPPKPTKAPKAANSTTPAAPRAPRKASAAKSATSASKPEPEAKAPVATDAAPKAAAKPAAAPTPTTPKPTAKPKAAPKPRAAASATGAKTTRAKPAAKRAPAKRAPANRGPVKRIAAVAALPVARKTAWSLGAVLLAAGAGVAAFLTRGKLGALISPAPEEGHVPTDLLDPKRNADDRAVADFRPDMSAIMTPAEREALRPPTGVSAD